MCGICGIVDYSGAAPKEADIRSMADMMVHRGPDDSGVYVSAGAVPGAALGHRRLSIIDLSTRGKQPMRNEDGSVRITLNGEIYNYRQLRADLEERGHRFESDTDTEAVVHLYEEYGEGCVDRLRGMFAFAIWDDRKKKLVLARDRVGKKPLVYYSSGSRFVFASEIAPLIRSGFAPRTISHEAIHYYLTFGYVPSPMTIYKDVLKLPPASVLVLQDGKISIKRYWKLDYSSKVDMAEEDASAEVLRLLKEAVKIRLYSDVPLGAFLSGGVDSSAVVALMALESGARVKTFSIGFADKDYDELRYAGQIARRFGTHHNELIVKPDAMKILPMLVDRFGEPYADSSCVPTYYVANQTRRFVTVALNGDGGDESFAGYDRYHAMLVSECFQRLPGPVKGLSKALAGALPDSINSKSGARKLKRFFDGLELPAGRRYLRWVSLFGESSKRELYSEDFYAETRSKDPIAWLKPYFEDSRMHLLDRLLEADVNTYLPDDLMVKSDITSMANSLEARSPFLDHKLMEFAARLPAEYKIKGSVKKYVLKKALKGMVPEGNIGRAKMGFGAPIGGWFRKELKGLLCDTLLSVRSAGRGYFKKAAVEGMVSGHINGKADNAGKLWSLLMLELWHEKFID